MHQLFAIQSARSPPTSFDSLGVLSTEGGMPEARGMRKTAVVREINVGQDQNLGGCTDTLERGHGRTYRFVHASHLRRPTGPFLY